MIFLFLFTLSFFDQLKDFIKDGVEMAGELVKDGVEMAGDLVKDGVELAGDLVKDGVEVMKDGVEVMKDGFEVVKDSLEKAGQDMYDKIEEANRKSKEKSVNSNRKPTKTIIESYQEANEKILNDYQKQMDQLLNDFQKQNKETQKHYVDSVQTGDNIIQGRDVRNFEGVSVSGTIHAYITQGNEESLKIEAGSNIIDKIETKVSGKVLYISMKGQFNIYQSPIAHITLKNLQLVEATGATKVEGKSTLQTNGLVIKSSGTSKVSLDFNSKNVIASLTGASTAELSGKTQSMKFQISGTSNLKAAKLEGQTADIQLSGASKAVIDAKKELRYELSGVSKLKYKSNPKIYKASCSQTSSVSNYDGWDL